MSVLFILSNYGAIMAPHASAALEVWLTRAPGTASHTEIPLSPFFLVHPQEHPVTPLFPALTERGGAFHFRSPQLFGSPQRCLSSHPQKLLSATCVLHVQEEELHEQIDTAGYGVCVGAGGADLCSGQRGSGEDRSGEGHGPGPGESLEHVEQRSL